LLDRNPPIDTGMKPGALAPEGTTPTIDDLPRRMSDFATLHDALAYAASGRRGMNFHDARGRLVRSYPYAELAGDALHHARRFATLGLVRGDRLALVAETGPEFAACFFGAILAGLWPVPLPLPTSFGGRDAYVDQLVVMLTSSDPKLFLFPPELTESATAAA
jgi:fatty-acyl-CoA synthase